jgi:serine phosphatase RsbU (regulator of sigma subunit)
MSGRGLLLSLDRFPGSADSPIAQQIRRPLGNRTGRVILIVVLFLAIALVDIWTSPGLSFLSFYFLPMLLGAWYFGRPAAVALALASTAVWLTDDVLSHRYHALATIPIWNRGVEIVFFVVMAWLAGTLRATLLRETKARAELLERDLEMAREVQAALLPPARFEGAVFTASAVCRQARAVGGDAYDIVPLETGALAVAVADVSGKGISAALLMANFLAVFRALLPLRTDQLDLLAAEISGRLRETLAPHRFVTAFLAVIEDGSLRYVNAGHEPAILVTPGHPQPASVELKSTGPVLGLLRDRSFREERVPFPAGSSLLIYTDGLTERLSATGEEFGRARAVRTAATSCTKHPGAVVQSLLEAADEHAAGEPPTDDLTILVVARRTPPPSRSLPSARRPRSGSEPGEGGASRERAGRRCQP